MKMLKVILCMLLIYTASGSESAASPSSSSSSVSAEWSVGREDVNSTEPCLLVSANLSVIFVHEDEDVETMSEDVRRLHWRLSVPSQAGAGGHCSDDQAELSLHWSSERGDKNLINLVITRNQRLADLSGVFARLHLRNK